MSKTTEAQKAAMRRYYQANKERAKERALKWQKENPEKVKEYQRKSSRNYWQNHTDKAKEAQRQWRIANPDKAREATYRWRENNPDKVKGYDRKRREKDVIKIDARKRIHVSVKRRKLIRPSQCSRCGRDDVAIEAHHEDYKKPLEVVWLCKCCHLETHLGRPS
jgi:Bacillus phage endonuclease